MKAWLSTVNWDKLWRSLTHAALMAGAIYIGIHPEYAGYSPILTYLAGQIDS